MISLAQAHKIIFRQTVPLEAEEVLFSDSLGRTLAEQITASSDWPPFNRSTVDGYAIRSSDTKNFSSKNAEDFVVIDTVEAGRPSSKVLKKGQAIKIMTGGVIPRGADSVLMKEFSVQKGSHLKIQKNTSPGENISFLGEDLKKGQEILPQGHKINPGSMALFAAFGYQRIHVYRKPRVGVLVTGNELLSVEEKISAGKIRSTNQYALMSQIEKVGGQAVLLGIAKDNPSQLRRKIQRGFQYDVLLVSGGLSVGDFDFVPKVLSELGVKVFFHGVSVQPGKPLLFGKKGRTSIFGLPGNPISTMVSFYTFVRPCLLKMLGAKQDDSLTAKAIVEQDVFLAPARTKILRGITSMRSGNLFVKLAGHQGSGNMMSMALANCLLEIPDGVTKVKKGSEIMIQYLP